MNYFSGFRTSHHTLLTWREFTDSQETKPCCVENDIKTVNSGFLSPASIGLILVFTIIFFKTSSQKSKTRVGYVTFHNNDFAALWDCYKVFRLSRNNFLDNFSFKVFKGNPNSQGILNWIIQILHYYYSKQHKNIENSLCPSLCLLRLALPSPS